MEHLNTKWLEDVNVVDMHVPVFNMGWWSWLSTVFNGCCCCFLNSRQFWAFIEMIIYLLAVLLIIMIKRQDTNIQNKEPNQPLTPDLSIHKKSYSQPCLYSTFQPGNGLSWWSVYKYCKTNATRRSLKHNVKCDNNNDPGLPNYVQTGYWVIVTEKPFGLEHAYGTFFIIL